MRDREVTFKIFLMETLRDKLKVQAALERTTMNELVVEAIEKLLDEREENK